jgi:hypothetical protein
MDTFPVDIVFLILNCLMVTDVTSLVIFGATNRSNRQLICDLIRTRSLTLADVVNALIREYGIAGITRIRLSVTGTVRRVTNTPPSHAMIGSSSPASCIFTMLSDCCSFGANLWNLNTAVREFRTGVMRNEVLNGNTILVTMAKPPGRESIEQPFAEVTNTKVTIYGNLVLVSPGTYQFIGNQLKRI